MNKLKIYWNRFKYFFIKWKIVNTNKFVLVPSKNYKFILTDKQQKQVEELYKTKGNMDYIFYFTGIGIGFKVKIWKTNEYIDLN